MGQHAQHVVEHAEERLHDLQEDSMEAADRVQSTPQPLLRNGGAIDAKDSAVSCEEPLTLEEQRKQVILRRIFMGMFGFQILLNLVDGCLPASLVQIGEEISLSYVEEGALGALVYLGLTVSSMAAGPIFNQYSVRKIIAISTFLCGVFCILFGLAPWTPLLLLCRFGIGASLAFITIYSPVWVDEFAPRQTQTLWMSLLQLAIPLGIMVGYGCGILTSNYGHGYLAGSSSLGIWRAPFIVEGFFILPLALATLLIPDQYLQSDKKDEDVTIDGPVSPSLQPQSLPLPASSTSSPTAVSLSFSSPSNPPPARAGSNSHRQSEDTLDGSDDEDEKAQGSGSASSPSSGPQNLSSSSPARHGDFLAVPSDGSAASGSSPARGPLTPGGRRRSVVTVNGKLSTVDRPTVDSMKPLTQERPSGIMQQLKLLIRNRVFVWTVLGLSALFFVVTGIQFWVTPYLVLDLGHNVGYVGLAFIFASATGPTVGVLFGGYVVDRAGGYQGRAQAAVALKICLAFVAIAVTCCILCIFVRSLFLVILLIWLTLFAGGALVPPATGILMSSVPSRMKSFASACAQMVYNLLGYCLSPALSGMVMQATKSRTWGFRLVLLWSIGGGLCILMAWRAAVAAAARLAERASVLAAQRSTKSATTLAPANKVTKEEMVDLILPSAATKASSFHSNSLAEVTAEQKAQLAAQQQQQQDQYSVGESQAMAAADAVQMLADGSKQINLAMGDDGQLIEDEDEWMLDQIPDLQQIQAQMIYHRGARMASVADFSALLPAFLVARTVKRNDQFSNTDLLMTEDGHVLAV